jgi:hypothetical protein
MWKRKSKVTPDWGADIRIIFPEAGLKVVFEECDLFDHDETGGRLVGTYKEHGGKLMVQVTGIIESGPQAKRSRVSFFQDGAHQEGIFRRIESRYPEIEHLGNWHTHHMNGLPTLSGGDIETYHRTVNHQSHNTPFFYALLVTAKHNTSDAHRRYSIKHFVFRRGDKDFYEIPQRHVELVDAPLVWPSSEFQADRSDHSHVSGSPTRAGRAYDNDIIGEFYPGVRPFSSQKLGVYWRGSLELLDGSSVEVVLLEDSSGPAKHSVALRDAPAVLQDVAAQLAKAEFPSARAALLTTERNCNRALYRRAHAGETKS